MEVMAPVKNAIVVYAFYMPSTQMKTIAAIRIMKIEHILYSDVIKAEAPFLIIAPIYTTPGCYVLRSLSSSTLLASYTSI